MATAPELIEGLSEKNRNWIGVTETKSKINFIAFKLNKEIESKETIADS